MAKKATEQTNAPTPELTQVETENPAELTQPENIAEPEGEEQTELEPTPPTYEELQESLRQEQEARDTDQANLKALQRNLADRDRNTSATNRRMDELEEFMESLATDRLTEEPSGELIPDFLQDREQGKPKNSKALDKISEIRDRRKQESEQQEQWDKAQQDMIAQLTDPEVDINPQSEEVRSVVVPLLDKGDLAAAQTAVHKMVLQKRIDAAVTAKAEELADTKVRDLQRDQGLFLQTPTMPTAPAGGSFKLSQLADMSVDEIIANEAAMDEAHERGDYHKKE